LAVNLDTGKVAKLYDNAHCTILDVVPPTAGNPTISTVLFEISTNTSIPVVYLGTVDLKALASTPNPSFASLEPLPQSPTHTTLGAQIKSAMEWSFETIPIDARSPHL